MANRRVSRADKKAIFESLGFEEEMKRQAAYSEEEAAGKHRGGGGDSRAGEPPDHEAIERCRWREAKDQGRGVEDRDVEERHGRTCGHRHRPRNPGRRLHRRGIADPGLFQRR